MALRTIRCGSVTLLLDDADGHIRHIRIGDVEILRGVYAAVRDRNWCTVEPRLSLLRVVESEAQATVTFEIEAVAPPVDFVWAGRIRIDPPLRRIDYALQGKARASFLKNRIGFCVLHSADLGGTAVKTVSVEGVEREGVWPAEIAPHQPFVGLRQISHAPAPGLEVTVTMSGDIFETEDQRNWTDASYKTYCTPLDKPFPVEVKAGDEIHQAISVQWKGAAPGAAKSRKTGQREIVLWRTEGAEARLLPEIGFEASEPVNGEVPTNPWLADLRPAHLRVDLRDDEARWVPRLRTAWAEARASGAALELAIFASEAHPARDFAAVARAITCAGDPDVVRRWLVFGARSKSTPEGYVLIARAALGGLSPGADFAAGTDAYFAELNRQTPRMEGVDSVVFSVNPQVHAFDDLSLIETLAIQGDVVRNAARIASGRPVVVSPVTLRPRYNPNATAVKECAIGASELPDTTDPRQRTIMGALWTLGSIKHLAEAGVVAATYYRVCGWNGLGFAAEGEPGPPAFPAQPGEVFPLWHVLRSVADFKGGRVLPLTSSRRLQLEGLLLADGARRRLLVAHFGDEVHPWRTDVVPEGVTGRVLVSGRTPRGEIVHELLPARTIVQWDWNDHAASPT